MLFAELKTLKLVELGPLEEITVLAKVRDGLSHTTLQSHLSPAGRHISAATAHTATGEGQRQSWMLGKWGGDGGGRIN